MKELVDYALSKDVSQDDLSQIIMYADSGNSLAASVARVIVDQTRAILKREIEPILGDSNDEIKVRIDVVTFAGTFMTAAKTILRLEKTLREGTAVPSFKVPQQLRAYFEPTSAGDEKIDWEKEETLHEAEELLRGQAFLDLIKEADSPQKFVDLAVERINKENKQNPDYPEIAFRVVELGRLRFHRLYELAQSSLDKN